MSDADILAEVVQSGDVSSEVEHEEENEEPDKTILTVLQTINCLEDLRFVV